MINDVGDVGIRVYAVLLPWCAVVLRSACPGRQQRRATVMCLRRLVIGIAVQVTDGCAFAG
ncbi:MAG: hypothetical protein LBJ16_02985 [Holosporaceae bacterium]|nr:hypothetical protein [Holosporaceae bacterium]